MLQGQKGDHECDTHPKLSALLVRPPVPDESEYDQDEEGCGQNDLGPLVQPVPPAPPAEALPVEVEEAVVPEETSGAVEAGAVVPAEHRLAAEHVVVAGVVAAAAAAVVQLGIREAFVDAATAVADARHTHAVRVANCPFRHFGALEMKFTSHSKSFSVLFSAALGARCTGPPALLLLSTSLASGDCL